MDREFAQQALKDLLAELPAEFSYSLPGSGTERAIFRVIKKSNVRKVHQALWDLQLFLGLQEEKGYNINRLEQRIVDDETKALNYAHGRGYQEGMMNARAGAKLLLEQFKNEEITFDEFMTMMEQWYE